MYLDKNFTVNGDFNASTINGINLTAFRNSVNQATGALEVYSSSLKNAITVAGTGVSSVTTIKGDLNVLGTTTQLQISDLKIEDRLIEIASGSTTSVAANGAGLFISGANVFFSWSNAETNMRLGSGLFVNGAITSSTIIVAQTASFNHISASGNISGGALFVEGATSIRGAVSASNTIRRTTSTAQRINQSVTGISPAFDFTATAGMKSIHRTSATNITLFNGTVSDTRTVASAALTATNHFILRSQANYGAHTLSMYAVGASLVSENANFITDYQTYLNSI
jgi:hypothetical protein